MMALFKGLLNQIINTFINESVESDEYIDEIVNFLYNQSVFSIDIHNIIDGKKNRKKFIYSIMNCAVLWLVFIIMITFAISDKLIILLENSIIPFDKMKQYVLFQSILLLQVVVWKTDELQFESRDNLGWLKFLHYLMVKDRSKHKLNNRNFRTIKLLIRLLHYIFIRISDRFSLLFAFCAFISLIFSRSITIIIFSPLYTYAFYVYINLLTGLLLFIYISMIYYWMRLRQINTRIQLFSKRLLQRIIQITEEHNEISVEIYKLNLLMNKSAACLFLFTRWSI